MMPHRFHVLKEALWLSWLTALLLGTVTMHATAPVNGYELGTPLPGPMAKGRVPKRTLARPETCGECHVQELVKWEASYRPTAFSNSFVQAQYALVWAKAKAEGTGDALPASCLACHSPARYLAGELPAPGSPEAVRGDLGITCDFCHSTWGYDGDGPGASNWVFRKGGNRMGPEIASAVGTRRWNRSPELCGTCHDERGPGSQWVKASYIEWKAGPSVKDAKKGCLDCHTFSRQHLDGLIAGAASLVIHPPKAGVRAGQRVSIAVDVRNEKAGHPMPGSSNELRQLWLHVEALDTHGKVHPLSVQPKGIPGEEATIGSDALAYQDAGELSGEANFAGLARDGEGIAPGDRLFRLPMYDAKGRMTAFEWNAASIGNDYRLPARETVAEIFLLNFPADFPQGPLALRATLRYRRVPPALWAYLKLPKDGNPSILVTQAVGTLTVLPSSP